MVLPSAASFNIDKQTFFFSWLGAERKRKTIAFCFFKEDKWEWSWAAGLSLGGLRAAASRTATSPRKRRAAQRNVFSLLANTIINFIHQKANNYAFWLKKLIDWLAWACFLARGAAWIPSLLIEGPANWPISSKENGNTWSGNEIKLIPFNHSTPTGLGKWIEWINLIECLERRQRSPRRPESSLPSRGAALSRPTQRCPLRERILLIFDWRSCG